SPLSGLTANPILASTGVMSSVRSWPWSGRPASSLKVSREPSPHGSAPPSRKSFHSFKVSSAAQYISNPSSPVYPVWERITLEPSMSMSFKAEHLHFTDVLFDMLLYKITGSRTLHCQLAVFPRYILNSCIV